MDVLDRQAWIGGIEADRRAVGRRREVDELLEVFPARRGRRILGEFEDQVEDLPDVLGEVRDVFVERAVIDGEESDLVIFKWNELSKVRRADFVEVFRGPAAPRARRSSCTSRNASFDLIGRMTRNGRCSPAPLMSAAEAKALISLAVTSG